MKDDPSYITDIVHISSELVTVCNFVACQNVQPFQSSLLTFEDPSSDSDAYVKAQ